MNKEELKLKGHSLQEWKDWIINELTEPVTIDDQVTYTRESCLELIVNHEQLEP